METEPADPADSGRPDESFIDEPIDLRARVDARGRLTEAEQYVAFDLDYRRAMAIRQFLKR